ncbi:MAG: cysteine desulfurase family protein [Rhodocyclaceae bacterium]|jgi:cysteine desulfurase|nr:cysteine desulfurase family protein [Rhodocyclaceae bacterium]
MFAPVYLDFNASSPLHPQVKEAMLPYLEQRFGNPSSRHEYGRQARLAVDEARARVAAAVGAHPTEVIFTSGGSEANNLFLKGAAGRMKPGVLAISAIEHPCVREPALQLERAGWTVRILGVDGDGRLRMNEARAALAEGATLASVMLANNETGVIQDVATLASEARRRGVWLHSDGVQALGKLAVDFRALGVHGLTLSAHKIGGPLGAGALVVDKRVDLLPLIAGGGQERGMRSGTENVPALVGFGVACSLAVDSLAAEASRLEALRGVVEAGLAELGAEVFSRAAERLPNTVFFALPSLDGETLVGQLDRAGYAVASGSACSSADPRPPASLLAMGVDPVVARGAVRVSLGRTTGLDDVAGFLRALKETAGKLRTMAAMAV